MLFSTATATAISLLGLSSIGVNAAAVLTTRNIETGSWLLVAKPPGDPTAVAIPIMLATDASNNPTHLATSDASGPSDIQLCIELTPSIGWQGETIKSAKVHNHPSITEDVWMWKSVGAKQLATSTRINITGYRGNWTFVSDPNTADMILSLDDDTVAGASSGGRIMHFGADIPAVVEAVPMTIVGVPVDSCSM